MQPDDSEPLPMQLVMLKARQHPDFDHDEVYGGSFINCYMKDRTVDGALNDAKAWVEERGWYILNVEEHYEIDEASFDEPDGGKEYYDQALIDGQVFVFFTYPIEDGEDSEQDDSA